MATWHCGGCDTGISENNPDMIVAHVQGCDYANGAGQAAGLTIKFSVTHWYIASIPSDKLAEVTGGIPFADLIGDVDDPETYGDVDEDNPGHDPDTQALINLLDGLAEDTGPAMADGYKISEISRERT